MTQAVEVQPPASYVNQLLWPTVDFQRGIGLAGAMGHVRRRDRQGQAYEGSKCARGCGSFLAITIPRQHRASDEAQYSSGSSQV